MKTKFWMMNNSGKLVWATEYATIEDARESAHAWNKDEERPDMVVDIIQNARDAREATKVTAVYSPSPMPLFDR